MEINFQILTGIYIYKNFDPYSDGVFKSILQLIVDEDDELVMMVSNGAMEGFTFNISYEELENNFVSVRSFLENAQYVGKNAFRTVPIATDTILDLNFTGYHLTEDESGKNILNYFTDNSANVKQIVIYQDAENMLMYYNPDVNKKDSKDFSTKLRFVNSKYINKNWRYSNKVYELYHDPTEVILDLYTGESSKTKRYLL